MISDEQILQFILIIDCLVTHFQYYVTNELMYLILCASLVLFHLLLLLLEQFYKNLLIRMICNLFKLAAILLISYHLNQQWMLFTGIQICCVVKFNPKLTKLLVLLLFCINLVAQSLDDINYLIIGIIRCGLNYILILKIFKQHSYSLNQLTFLMKSVTSDTVILLNHKFECLNEFELFENILKEQIIIYQDDKTDRIVTNRESLTMAIQPRLLDEKAVVQFKEIFHTLKVQNNQWTRQQYETTSNCTLIIEEIKFNTQKFCSKNLIQCIETQYILIKKEKQINKEIYNSPAQTKSLVQILSKVSHDMRTPLNAIINMQICLQDQIDPELSDRYLKPSLNSCRLLLNLVNDILDQAQIQNNKVRLVFKKFNMKRLIEKTISIFDIQKEKKELSIHLYYDEIVPDFVISDKNRVRQIIMNLLSNAVKYSNTKGNIDIICEFQDSNQTFTISISDNGLGIKPENLKSLFQEFARVEDKDNSKQNPNGIGLGLMICNELSKLLNKNGEGVTVISQYRQGSTFSFKVLNQKCPDEDLSDSDQQDNPAQEVNQFPESHFMFNSINLRRNDFSVAIKNASQEEIIKPFNSSNSIIRKSQLNNLRVNSSNLCSKRYLPYVVECEKSYLRKSTNQSNQVIEQVNKWMESGSNIPPVLIVDDNEFNIVVLQYLLEQLYITCDSAMSGEIALKKCQERAQEMNQFKIIFLDIEMPVMNGIDTAKKLLEFDPSLKIVACSGYRQTKDQLEIYKQVGMQGAIEKPVTKAHLKDLLCKLSTSKHDIQFSHYF